MRRPTRDSVIAFGFAVAAFALAFAQRPGKATSDTKIDLHVDPGAFLGQVASVWTHSIDLGAVQSTQYSGYLWPIGPFFAALRAVDLSPWVTHRLWLGTLFALSAWGMLRLLDTLAGRPRGAAHVVAAAFYLLNPYTAVFTGRTSVALVGYAALPWLLVVVFHGVRGVRGWGGWRGWWWAAAFALILTSLGGGINAAVVGWMLVGPLVLLLYEPATGAVRWRDSANFLARMGLLGVLASLWWIVPLLAGSRYGIDFLQFTEKPFSIWGANSAPEALRLMAYWTSYIGVGFHGANLPFFTESETLLFNPLEVGASLLLPALAILGFVRTRRFRYGPFLLAILLVGMAIEVAGFPDGTPMRAVMDWLYRHGSVLRFMRTTQKAAPLVAVGLAGLLGLAASVAWARLVALRPGAPRRLALVAAPAGLAALIALAALPLVRGTAVEKQLTWDRIPSAWTRAGSDLDRNLAPNSRALVLPGQIFGYYTWGGTVDPILPRLTDRAVAERYETPYSDPRSHDLLFAVDRLVQQRRLVPGQLAPLLGLMGVGAVITGSDDDIYRSGAMDPAGAAAELAAQGLDRPSRSYGPRRGFPPPAGEVGRSVELPQVRRYDVAGSRGLVHVAPAGPPTVVDGASEGLASLAAFGALPARRPILYAADLSAPELRRYAARGADVVVTDSNRRRRFLPEFTQQNLGATLGASDPIDEDWATIDPFPDRDPDAQTVSVLQGARYLRSPQQGGLLEFPEHAPIAAFDGDRSTTWAADRYLLPEERYLEIGFDRPRDVPYVDLQPIRDPFGVELAVDVNGVAARLGPGVTRVRLGLRDVSRLRVTLTKVRQPGGDLRGGGGFREIRIPGIRLRQPLRTPVIVGRALAGRDLRRTSLTYLFDRATADDPFRRDRRTGSPLLELPQNREDPEKVLDRATFAPASRSYAVDAWVQPSLETPDSALDRLLGAIGSRAFDSSDRFENQAAYRASSAFDGRPGTAWLGVWAPPSTTGTWISWRTARPLAVSRLRLTPARLPVARPTVVRVSWPGGRTGALRVAGDGTVALPRPVRARSFRVTVLAARYPAGATARRRAARAVGLSAVEVPGLPPADAPAPGPLRTSCGDARVRVGARTVALRPEGTAADLLAGRPLRARGCGGEVRMKAGIELIRGWTGTFGVDRLRLRSPAPVPPPPAGGGRVLDPGHLSESSLTDARVALAGPSWLVLGQSFSKGWEATCDGRALGTSRPIDGYANGWRAPADCRQVSFSFGPQSSARASYVVAAIVCALLVAFLLVARLRGRRTRVPAGPFAPLPDDRPLSLSLPRAAALALVATIPLAGLFAARAAVLIFPLLTLVLWRGAGPRRPRLWLPVGGVLALAATLGVAVAFEPRGVLVVVGLFAVILWRGAGTTTLTVLAAVLLGIAVPLVYALASPKDEGGFNFDYSTQLIDAHWLGVIALVLLAAARSGVRASGPTADGRMPADPWPAREDPPAGVGAEPASARRP